MIWQSVVCQLIGIWFIVAPFVFRFAQSPARIWTSVVGGVILFILAGAATDDIRTRRQVWIQYVNGLVGIWFVVAPWVLSFTGEPWGSWMSVTGGLLTAGLSTWLAAGVLPKPA
jgi:hypothetical protein